MCACVYVCGNVRVFRCSGGSYYLASRCGTRRFCLKQSCCFLQTVHILRSKMLYGTATIVFQWKTGDTGGTTLITKKSGRFVDSK